MPRVVQTDRKATGEWFDIGDVCMSLSLDGECIGLALDSGEGGWFSLKEFMEVLHQFISDRL